MGTRVLKSHGNAKYDIGFQDNGHTVANAFWSKCQGKEQWLPTKIASTPEEEVEEEEDEEEEELLAPLEDVELSLLVLYICPGIGGSLGRWQCHKLLF